MRLALFVLLALGIPVGVSMGVIGVAGMLLGAGEALTFGQLRTLPFAVVNNYAFAVLPMFVLMGVLAEAAGLTSQVFHAADLWLRRFRGGLYQAVIVGSAMFAAISGSTIVNAVVFTRIAFPEMMRFGYSKSLSIGSIAGSGSFAAMIPPSITMVIYAIVTEQSVGQLLIAGVLPGLLTAAVYLAGVYLLVRLNPSLAPPDQGARDAAPALARGGRGVADRAAHGARARRHLHRTVPALRGGRGRGVRRVLPRARAQARRPGVARTDPAGRGVD